MFKTILALALVGAAAANEGNCPTCDHITDQTACQTGRHPTKAGPHNVGCGPHPQPGAGYCAWNATLGNVTTPGCANCSAALGMAMSYWFCQHNCVYSGPNPVVMQGCSLKDPDCKTNNKKNGGPQWTCYNPDSVNANHTAWIPGSRHYCRANEEINSIMTMCKRHQGGCMDGGCPPPRPGPNPGPPPPSPPGPGFF